jgi:hypothetical protein
VPGPVRRAFHDPRFWAAFLRDEDAEPYELRPPEPPHDHGGMSTEERLLAEIFGSGPPPCPACDDPDHEEVRLPVAPGYELLFQLSVSALFRRLRLRSPVAAAQALAGLAAALDEALRARPLGYAGAWPGFEDDSRGPDILAEEIVVTLLADLDAGLDTIRTVLAATPPPPGTVITVRAAEPDGVDAVEPGH